MFNSKRIDALSRRLHELETNGVERRLKRLEDEVSEPLVRQPAQPDAATLSFYSYGYQRQDTLREKVNLLESRLNRLSNDFALLTQHLKVHKTTTSEVTRFSPCKKRK